MYSIRRTLTLALIAVALVALTACAPKTVDQIRAQYSVELNAWMPLAPPAPEEPMMDEAMEGEMGEAMEADAMEDEAMAGEGMEGEGADGMMEEAAPAGPTPRDIQFDVVVRFSGQEPLPGVTIDITHADASEQQKGVYRHYVETTNFLPGEPFQETFKIEGVPFEDGDVFSASIRPVVPEAEKGEYREYADAP